MSNLIIYAECKESLDELTSWVSCPFLKNKGKCRRHKCNNPQTEEDYDKYCSTPDFQDCSHYKEIWVQTNCEV